MGSVSGGMPERPRSLYAALNVPDIFAGAASTLRLIARSGWPASIRSSTLNVVSPSSDARRSLEACAHGSSERNSEAAALAG